MSASVTVTMKTCTKCLRELPLDQFHKERRKADGLRFDCKDCVRSYNSSYHATHGPEVKANQAIYYAEHLDEFRAARLRWKAANPEKIRRDKVRWAARRRARDAGVLVGFVPSDIMARLVELYGPTCMAPDCDSTDLTIDHVVPISRGGDHVIENLQLLCKSCNPSKGNRSNTDYRPAINQPRGNV